MRQIDYTNRFRRDMKRESRGRYARILEAALMPVVAALACDKVLAPHYRDHARAGDWSGCRDCHVKPDLVLLYQKPDDTRLMLLRLGSHSELRL